MPDQPRLRRPSWGQVHLAWVTMSEDGAEIANIALQGIFDRKGLDPAMFGAYDRSGRPESGVE